MPTRLLGGSIEHFAFGTFMFNVVKTDPTSIFAELLRKSPEQSHSNIFVKGFQIFNTIIFIPGLVPFIPAGRCPRQLIDIFQSSCTQDRLQLELPGTNNGKTISAASALSSSDIGLLSLYMLFSCSTEYYILTKSMLVCQGSIIFHVCIPG